MENWFTVDKIDQDSFVISEYRHWEETHCYLLCGSRRSLLIDTGLGICNIYDVVCKLTDKPVTAAATHVHWDHIGGHRYFPDFYVHNEELLWIDGEFPQPPEAIRRFVTERCDLPDGFSADNYEVFRGKPAAVLSGGESIDIGGRSIQVLHTPGHSPGHMCFWEPERGYLFCGDLIYKDTLTAWFPSTDPAKYLESLELVARLSAKRVFPAHHTLDIEPEFVIRVRDEFRNLKACKKLCHGSGIFKYEDWAVQL